ncbi:circadian clock KaiB family protein [Thiohalomonas denitrificans]|uniref:KaiB domain-containing protein n=1 Tax=Thiohalomonas denitrificans TaxID=415747 RepID=A0A1G5QMV4_9GAMM|nr:circadian clock KaiB family protein [Thiohalomonas denitrificans]SCZ62890.1 KaiB domain-containing protein [Thiohalomonas denitrificans]
MAAERFHFSLYVAGDEANSHTAVNNLEAICSGTLRGACSVEIIDVFANLDAALEQRIVITPTLIVRTERPPTKMVIYGNLSDTTTILRRLGQPDGNK